LEELGIFSTRFLTAADRTLSKLVIVSNKTGVDAGHSLEEVNSLQYCSEISVLKFRVKGT